MWKKKEIDGRIILDYHSQDSHLKKASFVMWLLGSYFKAKGPWIDESFKIKTARLNVKLVFDEIGYNINVHFYDDNDVEFIKKTGEDLFETQASHSLSDWVTAQEKLEAYINEEFGEEMLHDYLSGRGFNTRRLSLGSYRLRRKFKEVISIEGTEQDLAISRKQFREKILPYEGLVKIINQSRNWIKVPAQHNPSLELSSAERNMIVPYFEGILSDMPSLGHPFRENGYYMRLIKRLNQG